MTVVKMGLKQPVDGLQAASKRSAPENPQSAEVVHDDRKRAEAEAWARRAGMANGFGDAVADSPSTTKRQPPAAEEEGS